MNIILCIVVVFFGYSLSGTMMYAQSKSADIKRIITLTKAEDYVQSFSRVMIKQFQASFQEQFKKSKNQAQINTFMVKVEKEVNKMFTNIIKNDLEGMFNSLFTDNEIREILAFYDSPTGKKLLGITSPLSQQITKIIEKKYTPQLTLTLQNEARKFLQSK